MNNLIKPILLITFTCLFSISVSVDAQTWIQRGTDIDGEASFDYSGASVSISADGLTVAIGASGNDATGSLAGHVRVYKYIAGAWSQLGGDIDGEFTDDLSGAYHCTSISADGLTVAIGADKNPGTGAFAGHVRVYKLVAGVWTQQGVDIDGEASFDRSGLVSLSADGLTVAIGARRNTGSGANSGHVRVYNLIAGTWVQLGSDINGESPGDEAGSALSLSADGLSVAVGAKLNDGAGTDVGHVRIFKVITGTWVQQGSDIDGEAIGDRSGMSVSINSDGLTVAIGAPLNDATGTDVGHVRVYKFIAGSWVQLGADIDGEASGDNSGNAVSISSDGTIIAIGAYANDATGSSGSNAGQVRVYKLITGAWVQLGLDLDGEGYNDLFGSAVSVSDDGLKVAIGAFFNDGNGGDSGHTRVFVFGSPSFSTIIETTCDSYVSPSTNYIWTNSGLYNDTVLNFAGCDSIITINLTILNSNTGSDAQSACDTYTWIDGNTYTASNSTATHTLTNAAGCDSVVTLNLTMSFSNTGTDVQTACDNYTWIDGNTYTSSNSTGTHTLTNVTGCDSVVTLILTIDTVDASVSYNVIGGPPFTTELASNQNGATYQWINCPSLTPISGAINQSYPVTANGDYAVIVSYGSCIDTSACVNVAGVGIVENEFGNGLLLYPNPTDGNFSVDLGEKYQTVQISITDVKGKLIQSQIYKDSQLFNLKIEESVGVYFLIIESTNKKAVIRLIKE
jgi:hypothetical protein